MFGIRSCDYVARRLWEYADGRLPQAERTRTEQHLRRCARCQDAAAQYSRAAQTMRVFREERTLEDPEDWQELRHRLVAEMRPSELVHRMTGRPAGRGVWLGWAGAVLASALTAVLLIAGRPHSGSLGGQTVASVRTQQRTRRDVIPTKEESAFSAHKADSSQARHDGSAALLSLSMPIHNKSREKALGSYDQVNASVGSAPRGHALALVSDRIYLDGREPDRPLPWVVAGNSPALPSYLSASALPHFKDDFARPQMPLLADGSANAAKSAAAWLQQQADIVDTRLFRKITIEEKALSLEELCTLLAQQTNVKLSPNRGVRDEKVTVLVKDTPARDVLRAVARLFGYFWERTGDEGAYRYELTQDLRSRLVEEELRSHDLNAALLALDEAIRKKIPAAEQHKDKYPHGLAVIQLYARLSPADHVALRNGETLLFTSDSQDPDRLLPADLSQAILRGIAPFKVGADGFLVRRDQGQGPDIVDMKGARALASFHLAHTELGTISLQHGEGFRYPLPSGGESGMGSEQGHGNPLATTRSPESEKPDNARVNQALRGQAAYQKPVSLKPVPGCPKLKRLAGAPYPPEPNDTVEARMEAREAPPTPHVNSADVWEELHKQTGLPIVADYYTHLYPLEPFTMKGVSTFDALCRAGDAVGARWRKDGDFILARDVSYYWDKLKEVPNRLLAHWQEDRSRKDGLPFDDLLEMVSLTDAQLDSLYVTQGIRHCWGIDEWGLVFANTEGWRDFYMMRRNMMRALSHMPGSVRARFLQTSGVAFDELDTGTQQAVLQVIQPMGFSMKQLAGTHIQVEYVRSGRYVWHPRSSLSNSGDTKAAIPLVQGETPAEALMAALKIDPQANEDHIHPTRGVLAVTVNYPPGSASGSAWGFGRPL